MSNLATGPIYSRMGKMLAEHVDGDGVGTFLWAQAGDAWAGAAIFQEKGNFIEYVSADHELFDLILEAWEAEDPDNRWSELHYRILDGHYSATMVYADQIDPEEDELDRQDRLVREIFGDKPIQYPDP